MLISALDEAPADGGDAAGDTPRSRSEAAPPGQRSALIEEYERDFFGSRRTEVRFESKRLKARCAWRMLCSEPQQPSRSAGSPADLCA